MDAQPPHSLKDLPGNMLEIIYRHMDGISRCLMRIALSKTDVPHSSPRTEQELLLAERYINRHKDEICSKTRPLPTKIVCLLVREGSPWRVDCFVKRLAARANMDIDKGTVSNISLLLYHIENGLLTEDQLRLDVKDPAAFALSSEEHGHKVLRAVAKHCTPRMFDCLMSNPITKALVERCMRGDATFLLSLISNKNQDLIRHLLSGNVAIDADLSLMIEYVARQRIACVYATAESTRILLTFFGGNLSRDCLEEMLDYAEESLNCERAMMITTYMKTGDVPSPATPSKNPSEDLRSCEGGNGGTQFPPPKTIAAVVLALGLIISISFLRRGRSVL
jgi:hypothetical protein